LYNYIYLIRISKIRKKNAYPELVRSQTFPINYLLLCVCVGRWIPDSPRWLIEKGHGAEAKRILEEGTAYNRRGVPMADIQALPKDG
jgi:hypothetical protein